MFSIGWIRISPQKRGKCYHTALFSEQHLTSHLNLESFDFIENPCEADFMPVFQDLKPVCGVIK